MNVGLCVVEIHLATSHSLKEKRRVLRRIKDQLRGRFNVAVAEIDHQDLWQRATLGIVSIAGRRDLLESCFAQIRGLIERELPGEVADYQVEYLT